jgi:hypothetical protein
LHYVRRAVGEGVLSAVQQAKRRALASTTRGQALPDLRLRVRGQDEALPEVRGGAEMTKRATELEWLKWFYGNADFGPGDGDVRYELKRLFERETGKKLPSRYDDSDEDDQ